MPLSLLRMMSRGTSEGLQSVFASPTTGVALGVLGFVSAVLAVTADETALALVTAAVLVGLTALTVYGLRVNAAFDGPYRILESETTWDLRDPDGSEAEASKTQTVRFNYKTAVVQDTASTDTGDDPFAENSANHGDKLGHTIQRGNEYHAIIALHKEGQRGDEATLVSRRIVRDHFPKKHGEWIEITQSQRGETALTVMFPGKRPPHNVRIRSSRKDRTTDAGRDLRQEAGRMVYRLSKRKMKRGERYLITWDWEPRQSDAGPV